MLLRRASTTARPSTPIANQINRAAGDGVEVLLEPTGDRELGVLRALEIDLGQGYLLGRPLPIAAAA